MLFACGSTTTSHETGTNPDPSNESAGASDRAGAGAPGNGGGGLQLGGTGSLLPDSGGALGLGGAEDPGAFHGPVDLCLFDEDIPDSWGAGGAVDSGSTTCAVGVLGRFAFNHCRYELLETMPFDVDPFAGGHSHCCYRSKLVGCP